MSQFLRGTFYIDGELIYEGLSPEICHRQGLILCRQTLRSDGRLEVVPEGPHFFFPLFHPYLLTTYHTLDELRSNPKYIFQGPNVGSISKSDGYLHGDSLGRRITSLSLALEYSRKALHVKIAGIAGPVMPGCGQSDKTSLTFDIEFTIPISKILQVAPDCGEIGVKTLTDMLGRISPFAKWF